MKRGKLLGIDTYEYDVEDEEDRALLIDKGADPLDREDIALIFSDAIAAGDVPTALTAEVKRLIVAITTDPDDAPGVQDEAAHGLAYLWLQEGRFERDVFQRLVPVARDVVKWLIAKERRDWWDDYPELRMPRELLEVDKEVLLRDLALIADAQAHLRDRASRAANLSDDIVLGDLPEALLARVEQVLVGVTTDPEDAPLVQEALAPGLAHLWLQEGRFERDVFQRLAPAAREVVKLLVAEARPDWLEEHPELRR